MYNKCLLSALLAVGAVSAHASFTVATFADPASGSGTPLFVFDKTNKTLDAGWSVDGLTLQTPGFIGGGSVADAKFVMSQVALTELIPNTLYQMGRGQVKFYTSDPSSPFFTVDFDGGLFLDPFSAGSSELRGNIVNFSGPNVPGGLSQEQFAFSLANAVEMGDKITYTASFTSSAVPEPGTLAVLGLGISGLIARRRRKS
jgi:hypothetical protein